MGHDLARRITKKLGDVYRKNVYFTVEGTNDRFKPVKVSMTLNPAYVEHEYRKLPLSEQTDPLDFNPPAALKNEGVGINTKRNTTDYFIVPKYFSEGTTTTSKAILEKIANSSHPLASVAKALIPFDTNSPVELVSKSNVNNGAATYNSITHKIQIAKFASFRGLGVEPTLIHEILHAITVRYVEANPNSKEVKDLFALFAHSRQYKNEMEDDYGFTNLKEFIVAIFTDAEFVNNLSIKPPFEKIGKYSNAFEEIMDYILSLFKFRKPQRSLYMQAFDIATHIVQNGKAYNDAQAEVLPDEAFFTNISEDEEYSNLSNNTSATPIKEGVQELFNSNPELANQVYEALGFDISLPSIDNTIEADNKKENNKRLIKRRDIVLKEINTIEYLIRTNPDKITVYYTGLYEYDSHYTQYFSKSNWEQSTENYKTSKVIPKPSYLHSHLNEDLQKRIKNLQIINSSLYSDVEKVNYSNVFQEDKNYSSLEILKYISNNKKDVLSSIAEKLLKYSEKNNVEVSILGKEKNNVAGSYSNFKNKIEIYGKKNVTSHTLIHEIVHSLSVSYINLNRNSKQVKSLESILKNILDKKILKEYENFENFYEDYATKDIYELLSEIISRPDILAHLALYDTNYNLIKDAYKKETLLDQIVKILSDIFNFTKKEAETLSDLILLNAVEIFENSEKTSDYQTSQITPQQKQQAQQLYSQYLDSIFPDSAVKDIVYHGTKEKFDKFDKNITYKNISNKIFNEYIQGFYFSEKGEYGKEYPVLLNSKNIKDLTRLFEAANTDIDYQIKQDFNRIVKSIDNNEIDTAIVERPLNLKLKPYGTYFEAKKEGENYTIYYIQSNGNWELIAKNVKEEDVENYRDEYKKNGKYNAELKKTFNWYVVFNPEQIHILGNKQDIEGFKKFTAAPSKVDEKGQGLLFNLASPEINYQLKAISIINKNLPKIQQWEKQIKDPNALWNKIQKDLQVPQAQIELLRNSEGSSVEDKLLSFSANYSFSVESNVIRHKNHKIGEILIDPETGEEFEVTEEAALTRSVTGGDPVQHYSNLTVAGGTNYTENEISTPLITPSIKGHAQFSTDNGIGWFRSDEQVEGGKYYEGGVFEGEMIGATTEGGTPTKTRRILELQSDLFQKGRDKNQLVDKLRININKGDVIYNGEQFMYSQSSNFYSKKPANEMGTENRIEITKEEYENAVKNNQNVYVNTETENQNQFLQLLNKDNNWVTFFVKSIIQDSAKKGYEKVLFPRLDTIIQIESAGQYKNYKEAEKEMKSSKWQEKEDVFIEKAKEYKDEIALIQTEKDFNSEKKQKEYTTLLKGQENNRIAHHAHQITLLSVAEFYENTVTNILSKTYNVETITDEYGNTWNEVKIDPVRDASPIVFSLPQQQYNKYQTEANEETIEKVKALLAKLGVSVEITDKVMEEFGANALIDLSRRLIQMVEGKESESLTEEAMHLLTALLPEDILADLLSKITSYQIYKDTFNQYKNHPAYQNEDGTPNIDKIKFEAVGKLLAEFYIQRVENLKISEINAGKALNDDEMDAAKSVWTRIIDWIKNIFSPQMNEFQKVIQGLENGTLILLSTPSRQDKFLQVTFAKVEGQKLTGILTNGLVNIDITENASAPNAKILYAMGRQIDKIAAEDSKKLNSFKQSFSYMNKQAFSEAALKLNNAREIEELKERVHNTISYYVSLGNISIAMTDRAKSIRVQYKAGVNKAGEALSNDEKLYMSLEIDKMDRSAEIYIKELEEFRLLFIDSELDPFAESIANTTQEFTSLLKNNESVKIDMLKDVLTKGLKGKLEGYIQRNKKRELELIRLIPSLNGKEKINKQKELQEVQKNIATPPFSVNSIIADVMGPGNGKTLQGIGDWVDRVMSGGKNIKNEAAQLVADVLEDINRDSRKEAEGSLSEMQRIFTESEIKLGITGTEYDKFKEPVTRYQIKETSEGKELSVYEENVLVSETEQWKYDNQMEVISYLKWAANTGKSEEHLNQVFEKVFERKLSQEEKNDYPAAFKNIQKELNEVYGQSKYTQEYKDVQAILETTVLSTGETVKSFRQKYIDKIQERSNDLEEAITPEQILSALDEKNIALKELQLLSSTYKNGVKKTGDELIVAETMNRWKEAKKDKGIDEYYLTNQNKVRWEEGKEKVDKLPLDHPERIAWYAANTVIEISQDYYDRQGDITTRLANLLDRIKPKSLEDKERIDDLYYDLKQLTKGKRDVNGVIVGSEFSEEEVKVVKEIELTLKEIRDLANETSEKISKEDKAEMKGLLAELEDIQTKSLTEYWEDSLEIAMMQIDVNLSLQEQDEALQKSDFIKNNTINVTDKYRTSTYEMPDTIIRIGNKYYQPLTIWQHTTPSEEFKNPVSPSFKWKTYKVNDKYRNLNHETNQGNVALNNSTESIKRFGSKKYDLLTPKEKEFIAKLTDFYLNLQKDHPQYERMHLSIPRMQAEGAIRAKQRVVNAKHIFSGIATKAYWENRVVTATEKEEMYGEGYNIDEDRLNVVSKFIGNHIPLKRQEGDLYKIFGLYAAETIRAKNMRRVVPVLNTLKKITNPNNQISKNINYEIDSRVNMKTRLDKKGLMRTLSGASNRAMAGLGFTRLGTPWLITQAIKNTSVGLWNVFVNSPYLRRYSRGSIRTAVRRAMKTASMVSINEFSSNPPKELALIRRLSILTGKTSLETTKLNKDFLLKTAMATGYGMSALKKWSEMHLELVNYELLKMEYKIETGRDLLDEYDYINNELIPKNITSEKENIISKHAENMYVYTHGNFRGDNSNLAKAYLLGRNLLFMKGYIYNPAIKRIGSKRRTTTGEEIEGFYKIFWRVVKQSPTSVLTHLSSKDNYLSAEEKEAIWSMYKDFALINILGGALYMFGKALKESGDDDDEAKLEWYALLLSRKVYQEMSWANPADLIGKPLKTLFSDDTQRNRGGQIEGLLYYLIGRPAMDLGAQMIIPVDYKGLRFENDDIDENTDPFYSQYKDNWITFNVMKILKLKGDIFFPQSSLSGYEYFDRSIYQYEKEK